MSYRDSFTFNAQKFKELLLYIASKLESESNTGFKTSAVRLNKVLFYSDFISFMNTGKPITGATYIRKPRGPVASQMMPMKKEMIPHDAIEREDPLLGSATPQKRLIPLRRPNLSLFSGEEIALVDEMIEESKDSPAFNMSKDSHELQPWRVIPNDGEEIPYSTVTIPQYPLPLSQEEIDYGKKVAEKIKI